MKPSAPQPARKIILSGVVQGVGFRPFIYRHAQSHRLQGWVLNSSGRVKIHAQGERQNLDAFIDTLIDKAPDLSRPLIESVEATDWLESGEFVILPSRADSHADIHLPADLFTCDDCLLELNNPQDRRYRYPFINCTQCGPRYTLIEALPYDRPNTSMSVFPLCHHCASEYANPADRRYHAEPVACPECGPTLSYRETGRQLLTGNENALKATLAALIDGKIVAIKGIGGYHLVCDARNEETIGLLRKTKPRPHKPLAVMFPVTPGNNLEILRQYLLPDATEARLLESHARPIVLVKKKPATRLAGNLAPGLSEIGAMLPYSPLHHTLLNDFGGPLVATSANISGEPVLTENEDIEQRLTHVAHAFLHHDRAIVRPADDPVIRVIGQRPRPLRTGRGLAPSEFELPFSLARPVLATGAQMKNTVALAWDNRIVVSPHIGEMQSLRSLQTFEQCIDDLQSLYQVEVEQLLCDAHPGFTSSRWAHRQGLPVAEVYHHHAHASATYFEALSTDRDTDEMLVFTWDGVGLGPDGTLWGGDALLGKPGQWRRVANFRPFKLPGGERAGRQPWRSAAAICWESGLDCPLDEASDPLLYRFWQKGQNTPQTSAAGRMFDAAAALTGLCSNASFEGQGPMLLESVAASHTSPDDIEATDLELIITGDTLCADWSALIPMLTNHSLGVAERAARFHRSMALTLLRQAISLRENSGVNSVGLSGGVFQNRILAEQCVELLLTNDFLVTLPSMIPVNDAGISFGQIIEYGCRR